MSCSPFDLKEYFLRELSQADRARVEAHLKSCPGCREEMNRLRLTEAALCSLREEEIPRRIAFVSDQVFEPSPLARWWSAFWGSSARLGFAAAAMLSGAILISAFTRPTPRPVVNLSVPTQSAQVSAQTFSGADIDRRIRQAAAVEASKAVAQAESAHLAEIRELRDDLNRARYNLTVAASEYDFAARRQGLVNVAASGYAPPKSDAAGESR